MEFSRALKTKAPHARRYGTEPPRARVWKQAAGRDHLPFRGQFRGGPASCCRGTSPRTSCTEAHDAHEPVRTRFGRKQSTSSSYGGSRWVHIDGERNPQAGAWHCESRGARTDLSVRLRARARARGENREKDGWEGRKDDARAAARGKRTTYRNMSQQHSSPGTAGGDAALPPAAHRYVGPADGAPPSAAASFAGSTCTRCFMDPVTMSVCSLCSRPLPSSLPPPSPSLRGRVSRRAARQAQPHRQQRVEFIAPRTGPVVSNFQRQQKVTAAQALNSECHTHAYYLYPRQAHGPGTDTTAQQSAVSSIVLRYCMEACGVPRPPTLT